MRDSFLESATPSRQWLIKATEISNRSDNVSVCLDKTVVAKPAADEPGIPKTSGSPLRNSWFNTFGL